MNFRQVCLEKWNGRNGSLVSWGCENKQTESKNIYPKLLYFLEGNYLIFLNSTAVLFKDDLRVMWDGQQSSTEEKGNYIC